MKDLVEQILTEIEHPLKPKSAKKATFTSPKKAKLEKTKEIISESLKLSTHACLAFSGGSDSLALLDITAKSGAKPILIWVDTQMEYPGSRQFVVETAAKYGLQLRTTRAHHSPLEQWRKTGWPVLGKSAARLWMQQNRGAGFAINVSECCRAMKISPARILTRNLGCEVQLTGQRGQNDDNLRGYRAMKDGTVFFQSRDRLWIANPLTDWTDSEIKGYLKEERLTQHPARERGARTIGCVFCGGGSQYTNSGYRILRKTWPEAWNRFMVEWKGGLIILALKYKRRLEEIRVAVAEVGGLANLAKLRPWIFDFTRKTPLPGYEK